MKRQEAKKHSGRLSTPTGDCLIFLVPAWSNEKWNWLEQRAEPVPSRSVPDGINFLVATVDVQADRHRRFVVQVTGYGSRRTLIAGSPEHHAVIAQ